MATYQIGETVICSITVKDSDGALQNAATSMNVAISRYFPAASIIVAGTTAMTGGGSAGAYSYDFASAGNIAGKYRITYTAVDGTRTTIQDDEFELD
uniref:Uncharacterized protein n=1 Tax=viral metagenome TaxID=1070528 RepID=A0A6M3K518_9ZZZZ